VSQLRGGWDRLQGRRLDALFGSGIKVTSGSAGSGTVLLSLTSDASGNFYGSGSVAFGSGAYVSATGAGGAVRAMAAAITSGACNRCHASSSRLVAD